MSKEQPLFGIDVHSEYQRGLNFERARAEGYEFCIIKAAEGPYRDGNTYVPTGFKEFFRLAEAEGFVMGVYDFLLSTPAKAQADHFLRTIEAVGGPEDKILMVDFEAHPNPALTPGNEQLKTFISEVKRRVGDHPIVVYSGRGFWNGGDSSGGFDQYGADVAWDAYYLHMDPVRPKQFYANSERYFQDAGISWGWGKPWGGVEPWFWQFTSAGGVGGMNIDVNAYRGTSEQLLALTGVKERGGVAGDLGTRDGETRGGGTRDGKRRVLTHGVIDGTNFAEGYKYVMQLNNRMKYWVWSSGPVPDGEGAYAANKPLPPVEQLIGKRIFCAGPTNIIRRAARKIIPTRGDALYDGGIAAYFYTSAFGGLGPGFFSGVDVPFNLATAKKWARETGSGVLVGRSYRNNSLAGQGHVAILLPDGKVLQSFQFGADGEPGLNTDFTIEESHAGGYYEIMVHPKDWIDHDKGRDDKGRDERERDEKRRREGTDEEPYRPEQEFTDEEFEEIGREILKLFSRLQQNRTRRRE
jgi:GH25 family lysozyme M1 (1,4-beta-N-acetylmuramidase)